MKKPKYLHEFIIFQLNLMDDFPFNLDNPKFNKNLIMDDEELFHKISKWANMLTREEKVLINS